MTGTAEKWSRRAKVWVNLLTHTQTSKVRSTRTGWSVRSSTQALMNGPRSGGADDC